MAGSRSRIRIARMIARLAGFLSLVLLMTFLWLRFSGMNDPFDSLEALEGQAAVDKQPNRSATDSGPVDTLAKPDAPHPLDPVLELARRELQAFNQEVVDYTATMIKRERIAGKLGEENRMFLKIINRRSDASKQGVPLHVYLRFESPSSVRGREVIWVEGKNDGNLIAHEAGIFNLMSVTLPPEGTLAMMGNKYPITGIGMGNLFEKLIEKGERDRLLGDCEVAIHENERLGEQNVVLIEVKHEAKRSDFDFHIARIYVDTQRHLPVRYESYLWPEKPGDEPPLEEQYTYQDILLNVGLTEQDFDTKNPAYQFPN